MSKKDFSNKHSFFTDNVPEEKTSIQTKTKGSSNGYKPAYVEVKSKRVQLVFQPSIYERAKAKATKQGISLNEYIHRLIDIDTK